VRVAYSKGSRSRPFATPRQPLPPNRHTTFYATFLGNLRIFRQNSKPDCSYSGSFLHRVSHGLAWSRSQHRCPISSEGVQSPVTVTPLQDSRERKVFIKRRPVQTKWRDHDTAHVFLGSRLQPRVALMGKLISWPLANLTKILPRSCHAFGDGQPRCSAHFCLMRSRLS